MQSLLSLGIPGLQAEKHNSTFWLVWTLGTSASTELLVQLKSRKEGSKSR